MLSLYRAWLPPLCLAYPPAALPRPAPPPGAHRPIPRLATLPQVSPASSDSTELDVVELPESPKQRRHIESLALSIAAASTAGVAQQATASGAVLDVACCDGPVRFTRVLNESWCGGVEPTATPTTSSAAAESDCGRCSRTSYKPSGCHRKHSAAARHAADTVQYYPCKTCGSKFPSYYFVHKHRKQCHPEDEPSAAATVTAAGAQMQRNVDIAV